MCKRRSLSSMVTGIFTMENHETLFIFVESAVKHRFEVNKATWKGKMRRFSGCEENKKVLPDYEKFDTEREMCVCTARRWADFQWRITLSMLARILLKDTQTCRQVSLPLSTRQLRKLSMKSKLLHSCCFFTTAHAFVIVKYQIYSNFFLHHPLL